MRGMLMWLGCALTLAAAACADELTRPAQTPPDAGLVSTSTAAPTAVATAPPSVASTRVPTLTPTSDATAQPSRTSSRVPDPTSTPDPTTTPTPTASPEPTAIPAPTPTSTPSSTTKPTSKQLPIEPTQLERGGPRPMPIGLAVYYSIGNCIECCGSVVDHRRIVFDKASGTFREDRPLAFFDDVSSLDDHPVNDFRVSRSGQTLAATVCHVGYCMARDGGPTPDAELHLWISRDGGTTWADWGQLLPASRILEVTDDDVLVRSRNLWRTRTDWPWITDGDWDAMLARLAPVGLSDVEGRDERRYWVDSGEVNGSPTEPTPPAVGHITWYHHYDQPTDAVAWTGAWDGAHLLVFTDESGTIERVYAAQDRIGGAFVANDTLARSVRSYDMGVDRTTLELIDLTTLTIHDVAGLSLPLDYDHKAAGPQQEFYLFMTARPAQAAE